MFATVGKGAGAPVDDPPELEDGWLSTTQSDAIARSLLDAATVPRLNNALGRIRTVHVSDAFEARRACSQIRAAWHSHRPIHFQLGSEKHVVHR